MVLLTDAGRPSQRGRRETVRRRLRSALRDAPDSRPPDTRRKPPDARLYRIWSVSETEQAPAVTTFRGKNLQNSDPPDPRGVRRIFHRETAGFYRVISRSYVNFVRLTN